jgi:hypothetical protein
MALTSWRLALILLVLSLTVPWAGLYSQDRPEASGGQNQAEVVATHGVSLFINPYTTIQALSLGGMAVDLGLELALSGPWTLGTQFYVQSRRNALGNVRFTGFNLWGRYYLLSQNLLTPPQPLGGLFAQGGADLELWHGTSLTTTYQSAVNGGVLAALGYKIIFAPPAPALEGAPQAAGAVPATGFFIEALAGYSRKFGWDSRFYGGLILGWVF